MEHRISLGMESVGEMLFRSLSGAPQARPIEYHGWHFRSKLERRYAMYLDSVGEKWAYEPLIYGPRGRRYLPDFQILSATRPTFIEVKPRLREVGRAQWKMSIIWDDEPDALLVVASAEECRYFASLRGQPWASWQQRWPAS